MATCSCERPFCDFCMCKLTPMYSLQLWETEKEWFIQAPWGRICIVAWGSCQNPPILLVHGERDSLASYRPLMKHLPNNFYYVGMELPGHGRSDPFPPGLPVSLWDMVYAVQVVQHHFRWGQFVFMGHSLGASIGRLYNATHPNKITAAIELDQVTSQLVWPAEKFSAWYDKYYTSFFENCELHNSPKEIVTKYISEKQAIQRLLKHRDLTPELARATIQRCSEPAGKGRIRFTYDQRSKLLIRHPFTPEQIKEIYTSTTTPTLGIISEESVKDGLYQNTSFLLNETDTYVLRKVCGSHDVHIRHPDRVALFICQFLKFGLKGLERKSKL